MARQSRTKILNYRVILEKDQTPKGKLVYSATCPTLGVFDYGDTIDEALTSIKDGIESMVAFLADQKEEIPVDRAEESMVTYTGIRVPTRTARIALA
ncbi:type II toxin-antitoxin system HicB family antitoxin [Patescibacteria group bacterium]|nr:type II toxin-antitoxin system HicB family antitoxin [Patescibacteria group bacterium]